MQLRIDWSTSHHVDDDEDVVLHSLVDAALDAGPVLLLARDRKTKALEPKLFENVQWYLGNLALQRGELAGEWWAGVVRDQPEIGNSDALPALYHLKRLLQRKTRLKDAPVAWAYDLPGPYELVAQTRIQNFGEELREITAAYPEISAKMEVRPAEFI